MTAWRSGTAAALLVACAIGLAACTAPAPADPSSTQSAVPTPTATESTSSATPSPTPSPELQPEGSASDNLPYFASIVSSVWAGLDRAAGRAYVDALVTGGFDKTAMQVTRDESTVGNPAESIQFSVLWKGECLVGQVGPATGKAVAVVLPVVGDGRCLIGDTRPIDW